MDFSVPKELAHILLVSFPGQGHINPLLRLGTLLASKGVLVTFSTTESAGKKIRKVNKHIDELTPVGDGIIRFEFFDDGLSGEDDPRFQNLDVYLPQLELLGTKALTSMIKKHQINGHPVSCLINNPFIPWVSDVAETLNIPSAMLWVQSCACFSAYYHYHHKLVPFPTESDPEINVQLPCMPLLKYDEVPSFLYPTTPYPFLARALLGQYEKLSKPFCILIETFQELENDVIEYMSGLCPIKPVGPLFKSPNTPDSTIRSDFTKPDDCIEWLDSKNPSSVVYISFGSVIDLRQEQADEISKGLLNSGVCFLWVLRNPTIALPDGFLEKVGDKGKVVQWSPQGKVLSHKTIACFMTHCGWNSSMEALSSGVPLVAFPGWGDQVTNAKYLVDVLKVGVRLSRGEAANEIVSKEEVEKCLREVTGDGEKAVEMRKNALKWKKAAEEAVAEGGSSERSLQSFVDEVKNRSVRVATSEFNSI